MKNILQDKKVLVLGVGGSGRAAIHLLLKAGVRKIVANDSRSPAQLQQEINEFLPFSQVQFVAGGHAESLLEDIDLIIKSPGIHPQLTLLQKAGGKGIEVYSEVELAFLFFQGKLVGITGTNGKTTTTSLVGEIFRKQYPKVHVAGNIGLPFSEAVLNTGKEDIVIAELSSFQLENIKEFSSHISAVLNLSPDHLDYHKTFNNYCNAKKKIMMKQKRDDWTVLNWDDLKVREFAASAKGKVLFFSRREAMNPGVCLDNKQIVIQEGNKTYNVCGIDEIRIPGLHNLENALAATAISWAGGVELEKIAAVLKIFPGVAHRLEPVTEFMGISFVNDSKGTNPHAALNALQALSGPKILIAGGFDKGSDFHNFAGALQEEGVKKLILIGETAPLLLSAASDAGFSNSVIVEEMSAAVEEAFLSAQPGDTVLLSPACASWDMFKNFEERGNVFKEAIFALKERSQK